MPKVCSRAVIALLLGLLGLAWTSAGFAADKTDTQKKDDSESVFGLTRVWKIHLHVTAENWKTMQPAGGGFPGAPPAAGGRPNPGTERSRMTRLRLRQHLRGLEVQAVRFVQAASGSNSTM